MQEERREELVKKVFNHPTGTYLVYLVALPIFAIDQAAKFAVKRCLQEGVSVPVIDKVFHLTHIQNSGAAFGIFAGRSDVLIAISLIAISLLIFYNHTSRLLSRFQRIAIGLLIGGALGNLVERLASGRVTDFLDFRFWPVFNLGDAAISIGVAMLLIMILSKEPNFSPKRGDA
ncbi:MAG: signal peptidase II [Actinomycetota bacterium]|nr:signal peptidase II [Actinomycetota bacterium]